MWGKGGMDTRSASTYGDSRLMAADRQQALKCTLRPSLLMGTTCMGMGTAVRQLAQYCRYCVYFRVKRCRRDQVLVKENGYTKEGKYSQLEQIDS